MAKGGRFENSVSRKWSRWWTDGEYDDVFYRTHGSGSRSTVKGRTKAEHEDYAGDMMAVRAIGKPLTARFLFELKKGYSTAGKITKEHKEKIRKILYGEGAYSDQMKKIFNLFKKIKSGAKVDPLAYIDSKLKKGGYPVEWWYEAEEERETAGRVDSIVCFGRDQRSVCMMVDRLVFLGFLERRIGFYTYPMLTIQLKEGRTLAIVKLSDFFEWCPAKEFKEIFGTSKRTLQH